MDANGIARLRGRLLFFFALSREGVASLSEETLKTLLEVAPGEVFGEVLDSVVSAAGGRLVVEPPAGDLVKFRLDSVRADKVSLDEVRAVFDFWKDRAGKSPITTLTPKRSQKIRSRLSEGFSVEDLCGAVEAMLGDPFYNDPTPGAKRFNDVELVCRTRDHVERFLEMRMEKNETRRQSLRDRIRSLGR